MNVNENIMIKKENAEIINEGELVWYEVSELGIKMAVSKGARSNLKYTIESDKDFVNGKEYIIKRAYFYRQSVIDFLGSARCFNDDNKNLCNDFALSYFPLELNDSYKNKSDTKSILSVCWDANIMNVIDGNLVGYSTSQVSSFNSTAEYN